MLSWYMQAKDLSYWILREVTCQTVLFMLHCLIFCMPKKISSFLYHSQPGKDLSSSVMKTLEIWMHCLHFHSLPCLTYCLALEDIAFFQCVWVSGIFFSTAGWGGGGENVFYCNLFYLELYLLHLFSGTWAIYVCPTIMCWSFIYSEMPNFLLLVIHNIFSHLL